MTTTTTTASSGIRTGVVLEGKYLVGDIIGSGAVGLVFKAKNVELDENVAIKCLRPEMLVDSGMVARFAREAKAAAAIKSEYCATVHDVGMTSDGAPYIVMEFLEGKDLGKVLAESGTIGPRTSVEYALQVCEALAVAHSKGIVHRDIKPENLLLTERAGGMRIVKVLDFGISKATITGSIFKNKLPLVKTMSLMGTPLYMSPEQVRVSETVDVRSDIWSLGIVLYEILTGHSAFVGASITEICAAILEATPKPIELYRNDLPAGLVDVITKCLHKDANLRFQNIAELALALMPFGPKRTRLNVERAIAVLQGSGHIDESVRIKSTIPPAPSAPTTTSATSSTLGASDESLTPIPPPLPPIPPPPRVPGITPASAMVVPLERSGSTPSSSSDSPSDGLRLAKRSSAAAKRVVALGAAATALAVVVAGVVMLVGGKSCAPSVKHAEEPTAARMMPPPPPETSSSKLELALAAPSTTTTAPGDVVVEPAPSSITIAPPPSMQASRTVYVRSTTPKTTPSPITSTAPTAAAATTPTDCSTPFYFEGTKKVFKPGCL